MSEPPKAAARILIADDETGMRTLLSRALEGDGYAVRSAGDGIEALERIARERFDLVLVDVRMPRLGGLEVLARLKEMPDPPRAIVMTGDSDPDTLLDAIRQQAFHYIAKPFTIQAISELVKRVLAARSTAPIEVLSATPGWVELLVPCEREAAERIHDFFMQLKADLPQEVRDSVGTAFRELLLNAVEWGGGLDPSRKVRISYLRARRVLVYRISDPGEGFRLEGMEHAAVNNPPGDPVRHLEARARLGLRPGGLGILMAHSIVDELIYNEARNEVVFMKYLG